jgi:ATP-dependent Clp protease ATP-binding subunit ClpC
MVLFGEGRETSAGAGTGEERIARSADFLQHWFGRPVGVRGLAESGKEVLRRATAESERLLHNYLGTEHVLLGLLGDGAAIPARALAESGVELEPVREVVQRRIGRGTALVEGEIAMVPRVKTVVEMAGNEARRLGAGAVGAERLLLGLLREGGGIGALVIATLGADLYDVRDRTLAALQAPPPPPQ